MKEQCGFILFLFTVLALHKTWQWIRHGMVQMNVCWTKIPFLLNAYSVRNNPNSWIGTLFRLFAEEETDPSLISNKTARYWWYWFSFIIPDGLFRPRKEGKKEAFAKLLLLDPLLSWRCFFRIKFICFFVKREHFFCFSNSFGVCVTT